MALDKYTRNSFLIQANVILALAEAYSVTETEETAHEATNAALKLFAETAVELAKDIKREVS